jgi:flavin reductase (DIM6/NTAB) family NADH-FMN oxidoreductase RutF
MDGFSSVAPDKLPENLASLILTDQMLITSGTLEKFDAMPTTWALFGHIFQKPTASIVLCPKGYMLPYVNANPVVTLSFYHPQHDGSLTVLAEEADDERDKIRRSGMEPFATPLGGIAFREARILLECEKLYADWIKEANFIDQTVPQEMYPRKEFHRLFVLEVKAVWVKT